MKLHVIIGSTRPGRIGLPIGEWFVAFAKENSEFEVTLVDLQEINLPFFDEPNHPRLKQYTKDHTKKWSEIIASADAFVFVTPEYNYSMPAPLVNAIDFLSQEWAEKVAGIVSYGGASSGTRAAQQLKQLLTAVEMMPLSEAVTITGLSRHMVEGKFEPDEHIAKMAETMLKKLAVWSQHLKNLREEIR